ncbi:MAG: hypothetical protein ACRD8W_13855 [Nitrososphaeraceae archaeon]
MDKGMISNDWLEGGDQNGDMLMVYIDGGKIYLDRFNQPEI